MLIGACWPYMDQRPAPPETWDLLDRLRPRCIRIAGNMHRGDLDRLLALQSSYPIEQWAVRAKLPKLRPDGTPYTLGDDRPDLLDYREWPSEPSLRETLEHLARFGLDVIVESLNEPDIEWDEPSSWGPADRWEAAAAECEGWLRTQQVEIKDAFGWVGLVLPALSQGWPERHEVWSDRLEEWRGGYPGAAVHAYTNGASFDDPDWGGRPIEYAARFPRRPIYLTEVNDNGWRGADAPARGQEVGAYLAWLRDRCPAVQAAYLFALPGNSHLPWWDLTAEMIDDVHAALSAAPPVQGGTDVPEFVLGFKAKAEELGADVVGEPLEDQDYLPLSGGGEIAFQTTSKGVMVYSRKANRAHFIAAR